jgi:hypothetical protein
MAFYSGPGEARDGHESDDEGGAFPAIAQEAPVHVGAEDGEPHAAGFAYIGLRTVVAALVREYGRDEGGRMVDPQVGRLEGDHGVGSRVRLAEGVSVEGEHHRPDFFDGLLLYAVLPAAGEEAFLIEGQLRSPAFFAMIFRSLSASASSKPASAMAVLLTSSW